MKKCRPVVRRHLHNHNHHHPSLSASFSWLVAVVQWWSVGDRSMYWLLRTSPDSGELVAGPLARASSGKRGYSSVSGYGPALGGDSSGERGYSSVSGYSPALGGGSSVGYRGSDAVGSYRADGCLMRSAVTERTVVAGPAAADGSVYRQSPPPVTTSSTRPRYTAPEWPVCRPPVATSSTRPRYTAPEWPVCRPPTED